MLPTNLLAMFCEDIREEEGGTVTLIGVLPENIRIGQPPSTPPGEGGPQSIRRSLSKLCIYARINFDPDFDIGRPSLRLVGLADKPIEMGVVSGDIVTKTRADAKTNGNLFAGVVYRVAIDKFQLPKKGGTLVVEIIMHDKVYQAGSLTYHVSDTAIPISSTAH